MTCLRLAFQAKWEMQSMNADTRKHIERIAAVGQLFCTFRHARGHMQTRL